MTPPPHSSTCFVSRPSPRWPRTTALKHGRQTHRVPQAQGNGPYRASYSHRGRYTLGELIDFDQHGLWSWHDVRFSVAGTLLATAAAMVSDAPAGQFSEELDNRCTSAPRMPCVSWFSSAS